VPDIYFGMYPATQNFYNGPICHLDKTWIAK